MIRAGKRQKEDRRNRNTPVVMAHKANRNPDNQWRGMVARGGMEISLTPIGPKISVDLDDPESAVAALPLSGVVPTGDES